VAKKQTFADKASKQKTVLSCPVCNDPLVPTLVLQPVTASSGAVKMKEVRVSVCKCNRKEVYG